MPYTPQTWADGEAGGTPITAARLSVMEAGIDDADTRLGVVETAASTNATGITDLGTRVTTLEARTWTTAVATATSYSYSVPRDTFTTLTSMSFTITPPAGRTVDVVFKAPRLQLSNNTGLDLRLRDTTANVDLDYGNWSTGAFSLWIGAQGLSGSFVGDGTAHTIAVQGKTVTADSIVAGGGLAPVTLRWR